MQATKVNNGASSDNISPVNMNTRQAFKYESSNEEMQEFLLQELENLFDKPCLIPAEIKQSQPAAPFNVGLQKDYSNTFLVTNPIAIFKVFQRDQFLKLSEATQNILLDRLDEILQKCQHNSLIITDLMTQSNQVIRTSKNAIAKLRDTKTAPVATLENKDFLNVIIHFALKLCNINNSGTKKMIDIVRKLTTGRRFQRSHLEFIYQYLKIKCSLLALKGQSVKAKCKVDTAIKILQSMFEQRFDIGPCNYFYFSGYLSGIQVNTKQLPQSELFSKGFAASMWFQIADNMLQDDKNLPVLFNCFFQGHGGFECYFNTRKLYYRVLPKNYTPPNVDSNGVLIGEIQPKKWTFFAIEHDRPYLTRPQLTAILNDKQVVSQVMDYPRIIDKQAKISMVVVCQNFVGQLSTFILFKEIINNTKKMIQIGQQAFEFGFYSQQQLQNLKNEVFDQKIIDKLLILYSPERASGKMVYDCVEFRDGELMINSGVCNTGPKAKLFHSGGLNSLLPLLEMLAGISLMNKGVEQLILSTSQLAGQLELASSVNEFLKLVISVLQQEYRSSHTDDSFFTNLFYLLQKLPPAHSVNPNTVSLLADIRFHICDAPRSTQEDFFHSMMRSSDFWVNTDQVEVIEDFWLFVKAVYQQNPVTYNRIFSIQNLIDLMVKISEIQDGGYCCQFHRDSYIVPYQQSIRREKTIEQWVVIGEIGAQKQDDFMKPGTLMQRGGRVHQIDKYLGPIAGVLEGVLTSGGNEVLDQIQFIAKALTVKISPCFHLQMLKLLKVLLLDSKEDRQCASPADFAASFLKAKGLQILLHLCSYSSFDVKSMCLKLIDVLSSHTSLIKMAIDPDVITYLCSIILPWQILEIAKGGVMEDATCKGGVNAGTQQYQIVDEEQVRGGGAGFHQRDSMEDELERQMNQLLAKEPPVIIAKKDRKKEEPSRKKFGAGLFLEDDEAAEVAAQPQKFEETDEINEELKVEQVLTGNFMFPSTTLPPQNQFDVDDDMLVMARPPPPAPKNRGGAKRKNFDFDSGESSGKSYFKSKRPLTIAEAANEEEEEEQQTTAAIEELIMQVDGSSTHGGGGAKSDDDTFELDDLLAGGGNQYSTLANKKMMFTNTQKLPSSNTKMTNIPKFKGKGLQLSLDDSDSKPFTSKRSQQLSEEVMIPPPPPPVQKKRPQFNAFAPQQASNEQEEESFANENVMSKSNLRQPKSFNFGFPDSDDSSENEEEEVIVEEEENKQSQPAEDIAEYFETNLKKKQQLPSFKKKGPPMLSLSTEGQQESNVGCGTTGATSDSELQYSSIQDQLEETKDLVLPARGKQSKRSKNKQTTTAVISYQQKAKLFTNANASLNIDTDAINELFNYGGEKGQIMMSEDEEMKQFEGEIEELASLCIAAMNRKKPTDPIKYANAREKTTFETKYLKGESERESQKSKNPRKQFMTPQSVRGIKKIEFSMSQEEKNEELFENSKDQLNLGESFGSISQDGALSLSKAGFGLKSAMFTSNTILEEISGTGSQSSHSSSNKQDINFPGLLSSSIADPFSPEKDGIMLEQQNDDAQIVAVQENQNDQEDDMSVQNQNQELHIREIENLYTSCLEWIISRAPSSLYENIVIDECDKVSFLPALQLLMTLVTHSNNLIRQRALTDLEMLAKWDSSNGVQIMMLPQFHTWLLDLLLPYQDMANKYSKLQGSALAVYDIGCKLHTILLKNACVNSEEEAYKKINFVSRWPSILQAQLNTGVKDRSLSDIDTANKLSRVLLTQLISSLKDETVKSKGSKNYLTPIWQNLIYISSLVEEMIFGSHNKEIQAAQMDGDIQSDFNGQPLFKWIHDEGYLLYYNGSNEKSLWAEWDLLESLFGAIDQIYPEWTLKALSTRQNTTSTSIDESIYSLLEKTSSADDFNSIVELLMHDQTPYKASSQQSNFSSNPQPAKKQSKKGILGGYFSLSSSHKESDKKEAQNSSANIEQANQKADQSNFMWNILNMMCIGVTQSDTKQLVSMWLERFEHFTKFIMIVSESWKSRMVASTYQTYQKRFADVLTFALSFLFHEIHATKRTSPTHQASFSVFSAGIEPNLKEDQLLLNKLYAQSLKSILIFFINIIEYSRIKNTPSQLESHISACRYIYTNVLVKTHDHVMLMRDISKFKQNDYEDFPELFYMDDWKVTFFKNPQIQQVVGRNVARLQLMVGSKRRQQYSLNYLETLQSNEKTKIDIVGRMSSENIEVIQQIIYEEDRRKNEVALLNDNFVRQAGCQWWDAKKTEISSAGMWSCRVQRLKMTSYKAQDGTRCIMKECYGSGKFQYFQNNTELEKKIFGQEFSSLENHQLEEEFDLLLINDYLWLIDSRNQSKLCEPKRGKSTDLGPHHRISNLSQPNDDEDTPKASEEDEIDDEGDQNHNHHHIFKPVQSRQNVNVPNNDDHYQNNQQPLQVVHFLSKLMSSREKQAIRKSFVHILRNHLINHKLHNSKHKDIISEPMPCEILKPLYKRVGYCTLTSHEIIFFDELSEKSEIDSNNNNIFFFKYNKKPNSLMYKVIPLPDIKELQRRRFLGRKSALEIQLMNGKSLMLNFANIEDRDTFGKKIVRQRSQRAYNLKYYETLEPRRVLKKRDLTEQWLNWKISNFEYITLLNQLSGRSYCDLSQYPVFPWIFSDFSSTQAPDLGAQWNSMGAPNGFRDLNKNMQLLGSAERQAEFKKKYDDQDSFETLQERFHCGSHYSNPGIVLHYLSRVSPYIDALVSLHGKSLDSPDRGFHSLNDSFNSALNDHADVRELIPEFFYCPELLLNANKINFGIKQDGERVDHVKLPQWSLSDPYLLVIYMREAFESQYVSQNLNGWIDYIFGYKQREADAERSLNCFSKVTYEDGIDIDSVNDPMLKQSYQEQIYNYGQTPSQLFSKQQGKHPQKLSRAQAMKYNLVVDSMAKIKVYKPVVQQQMKNTGTALPVMISPEAILRAKFVDDQTIVGLSKDGNVTYFFWLSKAHELNPNTPFTCCEDKKRKFDNQTKFQGLDLIDRSIKRFEFPLLIMGSQKCVLRGGFWCGKIQICPIEGLNQDPQGSMPQAHQATVTALVCTSNEKTVISGSKCGDLTVYVATPNSIGSGTTWHIRKHMCHHESIISTIFINEDMNMYLSCSLDGQAQLYNLYDDHHLKSFHHPTYSPLSACVLSQTPLPCVALFSREDHLWYSFSLNNPSKPLEQQREDASHMISPCIVKDTHSMDRLVYGTEKGYLVFRQLPLLKQVKKLQVSLHFPVLSLVVSPDRRFLMVGCGDGGLNVVTEPFIAQSFGPQISNLQIQSASSATSSLQNSTASLNASTIITSGNASSSYRE